MAEQAAGREPGAPAGRAAASQQAQAAVEEQLHPGATRISLPVGAETLADVGIDPLSTFAVASTYVGSERDFFASSVGQVVAPYTLDSTTVPVDSNGDRVIYAGTTLQMSGAKVGPRSGAGTCVGILRRSVNARWADVDVGVVIGGHVNQTRLTDGATYGAALPAQVKTDLAALGVFVVASDA